jgi:hypothetical protein
MPAAPCRRTAGSALKAALTEISVASGATSVPLRPDNVRGNLADRGTDAHGSADSDSASGPSRAGRETRRDETARLRDVSADLRDLAAEARDRTAEDGEEALLLTEYARDSTMRALVSASGEVRKRAAADRADAAKDRQLAAADRADAGEDRGRVERQRQRDVTAGSRDLAAAARDETAGRQAETMLINEASRDSAIQALLSARGLLRDRSAADRADSASGRYPFADERSSRPELASRSSRNGSRPITSITLRSIPRP